MTSLFDLKLKKGKQWQNTYKVNPENKYIIARLYNFMTYLVFNSGENNTDNYRNVYNYFNKYLETVKINDIR